MKQMILLQLIYFVSKCQSMLDYFLQCKSNYCARILAMIVACDPMLNLLYEKVPVVTQINHYLCTPNKVKLQITIQNRSLFGTMMNLTLYLLLENTQV